MTLRRSLAVFLPWLTAFAIGTGLSVGTSAAQERCVPASATKLGEYWYDSYQAVEPDLDRAASKPLSVAKLDSIIQRLRSAALLHPNSEAEFVNPTDKTPFTYVPYFRLAQAFNLRAVQESDSAAARDYATAKLCLEEEERQRKITGSDYVTQFNKLKADVQTRVEQAEFIALAADFQALPEKIGSQFAQANKCAADVGEKLSAFKAATSDLGGARNALLVKMIDCAQAATTEVTVRVTGLTLKLPGYKGPVDAAKCDVKSENSLDGAKKAYKLVIECAKAEVQFVADAGRWACGDLDAAHRATSGLLESERALAQSREKAAPSRSVTPPPSECANPNLWSAAYDQTRASLQQISSAYPGLKQSYDALTLASTEWIRSERDGLKTLFEQTRNAIPSIDATCESALRTNVRARFDQLRSQLDPRLVSGAGAIPSEIIKRPSQASNEIANFVTAVRQGVETLSGQARDAGFPASEAQPLGPLASRYATDKTPDTLRQLCAAAQSLNSAIVDYWVKQAAVLAAQLDTKKRWLEQSTRWLEKKPTGVQPATEACVPTSAITVRSVGPMQKNSKEWVDRARNALAGAESCLEGCRTDRDAWALAVVTKFLALKEVVEGVDKIPPGDSRELGEFKTSVESLRGDVKRLGPDVERVRPHFAEQPDSSKISQSALEQSLGAMAKNVDSADWTALEKSDPAKPEALSCWKAVRDTATFDVLVAADEVLKSKAELAARITPFTTLSSVFQMLAEGQLDQAIVKLRGSFDGLPTEGRVAAMSRATLGYVLWLKSVSIPQGSAEAELLRKEIATQVDAARKAERNFRPRRGLFASKFDAYFS